MYPNEKAEFAQLLTDLCLSVDRPFDKDLLRVFWNDLQHIPMPEIQRQAAILRGSGKKRFSSHDLRPPPEERGALSGDFDNHAIIDRLDAYMLRNIWPRLTNWQRVKPRTFEYTRDKVSPRVLALIIDADGDSPGHRIAVADCALDYTPPLPAPMREQSFADRYQNFDEAAAVREVLNRRDTP